MKYHIQIMEPALEHLDELRASDRKTILEAVEASLVHEPSLPAKNRKPMRPNKLATWELRIGSFRVYYDVVVEPEPTVVVVAVGLKEGAKVLIAGEKIQL